LRSCHSRRVQAGIHLDLAATACSENGSPLRNPRGRRDSRRPSFHPTPTLNLNPDASTLSGTLHAHRQPAQQPHCAIGSSGTPSGRPYPRLDPCVERNPRPVPFRVRVRVRSTSTRDDRFVLVLSVSGTRTRHLAVRRPSERWGSLRRPGEDLQLCNALSGLVLHLTRRVPVSAEARGPGIGSKILPATSGSRRLSLGEWDDLPSRPCPPSSRA
jgi:hypothetical protein